MGVVLASCSSGPASAPVQHSGPAASGTSHGTIASPPALGTIAGPPGRSSSAVAYDGRNRDVVLFGGLATGATIYGDTWTWDGRQWTQRKPATQPPARYGASMVYDAARKVVLLFGGWDDQQIAHGLQDTWTWDGANWSRERPVTSPLPRGFAAMAYDSRRRVVVMFGGHEGDGTEVPRGQGSPPAGPARQETWTWDGVNWTPQHPAHSPSARYNPGMGYDETRGKAVLFGGRTGQSVELGDTWTWDGVDWNEQHPPLPLPPARGDGVMLNDAALRSVLLIGYGRDPGYWTWDGQAWTRTDFPTNVFPNMGAIYDTTRDTVVLFSYRPLTTGDQSQVWTGNGKAWSLEATWLTQPPLQAAPPLIVTVSSQGTSTVVSLSSDTSLEGQVTTADRTPPMPTCHPYLVTYLPCVSTSNSRAYFLDGDANVRYVAAVRTPSQRITGSCCASVTTGAATHVPGSSTVASAFAVSPDDQRIAVSVFSFQTTSTGPVPTSVRLYVEDLAGGGNHVEIFSSTSLWVWPVGWHDGKLVVAVGSPTKPQRGPYGAVTEFHLVNPATGDRIQALGSAACPAVPALLSAAGTVCVAGDGSLQSQFWSGPNVTFLSNYRALNGGAMLSPDGTRVAVCCVPGVGEVERIDAPGLGGAIKVLHGNHGPMTGGGWLDTAKLTYGIGNILNVVDTTSPYGPIPLAVHGELAGVIPGGL